MKLLIKADTEEIRKLYEGHGAIHKGDSGVDLFFHQDETIPAQHAGYKIKLGIHCAMVDDNDNFVSYILMPRSSISKTPLRMSNSIGLIDARYTGEIMAAVDIVGNITTYHVSAGTRLFQIVAPNFAPFTIELVSELPDSDRGDGGFGSTGEGVASIADVIEATMNAR